MPSPDDILEGLPSPSSFDDEPANLRRDIVDELSDHLECAVQRELRRTDDPHAARQTAFNRFGNPRQVARRLWLDAMKGQLMNQRIMIGTQVLMIIVIAVLCITFLVSLRQNQRMQEAMLARMEALGLRAQANADPAATASFDWPRYHLQVAESTGHGVKNLPVSLSGEPYNAGEKLVLKATTDNEGRATFGPMRAGGYNLRIINKSPSGTAMYTRNVAVPPGPDQPPLIVQWLDLQPKPVTIPVTISMPKFGEGVDWIVLVEVTSLSGPDEPRDMQWGWPSTILVLDEQGRVAVLPNWDEYKLGNRDPISLGDIEKLSWTDHITLDAARRNAIGKSGFYCRIKTRDGSTIYSQFANLSFRNDDIAIQGDHPELLDLTPDLHEGFVSNINDRFKPGSLPIVPARP